jgi:hypothetical protein
MLVLVREFTVATETSWNRQDCNENEQVNGGEHDARSGRNIEVIAREEPEITREQAEPCSAQHHGADSSREECTSCRWGNQESEHQQCSDQLETSDDGHCHHEEHETVEETHGEPGSSGKTVVE